MENSLKSLIEAYDNYLKLLGEELDELAMMAIMHGWGSKRVEQGKILREKIEKIKTELTKKEIPY